MISILESLYRQSSQDVNFMLSHSQADFLSQQSEVNTPYSTTQAHHPRSVLNIQPAIATNQQEEDSHRTINGYQDDSVYSPEPDDAYSYQSTSLSSHNTVASSEQQQESWWDDQGYQQYGQYHLLATGAASQEQFAYDPVLIIDPVEGGGPEAFTDFAYSNPPRHEVADTRLQQLSTSRQSTQQRNHADNIAYTPTARRWSREYSPEERMRVGLRRWENEQARTDYDQQCRGRSSAQPRRQRRRG